MDLGKPAWLSKGPDCEVVISSRVRIARNLRDRLFPHRLSEADKADVESLIVSRNPSLVLVRLADLPPGGRDLLAAVRLAPVSFVSLPDGCVLLDRELAVSILVNEEDHVRIQAIQPGSSLSAAADLAEAHDHHMSQNLRWAWNNAYGFLTASPANAGSGVRASSLCHLPGLAAKRSLARWLNAASEAGVVMRGVYGEGSRAVGGFFQLSVVGNRTETCKDAAGRLLAIVKLLAGAEREAREALGRAWADRKAEQCADFLAEVEGATLGESLRVLGWMRLAAAMRSDEVARGVDGWSAEILIDRWRLQADADARRAATLRRHFGGARGPERA
jgi:protein arginine kinase